MLFSLKVKSNISLHLSCLKSVIIEGRTWQLSRVGLYMKRQWLLSVNSVYRNSTTSGAMLPESSFSTSTSDYWGGGKQRQDKMMDYGHKFIHTHTYSVYIYIYIYIHNYTGIYTAYKRYLKINANGRFFYTHTHTSIYSILVWKSE